MECAWCSWSISILFSSSSLSRTSLSCLTALNSWTHIFQPSTEHFRNFIQDWWPWRQCPICCVLWLIAVDHLLRKWRPFFLMNDNQLQCNVFNDFDVQLHMLVSEWKRSLFKSLQKILVSTGPLNSRITPWSCCSCSIFCCKRAANNDFSVNANWRSCSHVLSRFFWWRQTCFSWVSALTAAFSFDWKCWRLRLTSSSSC